MTWFHTCDRCGKEYLDNSIGDVLYCPSCEKIVDEAENKVRKAFGTMELFYYQNACRKRALYNKRLPRKFAKLEK